MDSEPKYQLVIWFNQKHTEINELFRFVNGVLPQNIEKKVGFSTDGYLTLNTYCVELLKPSPSGLSLVN